MVSTKRFNHLFSPDGASRGDLAEASRAVYDEVLDSLGVKFKSIETNVTSNVTDLLEKEIRVFRIFEKEIEKHLQKMEERFEAKVKTLVEAQQEGWKQIVEVLRSLPVPQVTLEASKVEVNVPKQDTPKIEVTVEAAKVEIPEMKPVFNVNVPELAQPTINVQVPKQDAPQITVEASKVEVNVPKQDTPTINIQVPEQEAPKIEVTVPARKLVKKTFQYDQQGRPSQVIEEEV